MDMENAIQGVAAGGNVVAGCAAVSHVSLKGDTKFKSTRNFNTSIFSHFVQCCTRDQNTTD